MNSMETLPMSRSFDHPDTDIDIQAFFLPTTTTNNDNNNNNNNNNNGEEAQVLITLRVTGGPQGPSPLEIQAITRNFSEPLHVFLHPRPLRDTISSMLSHINYSDDISIVEFWTNSMFTFCDEAARAAASNGSINAVVMVVEIYMYGVLSVIEEARFEGGDWSQYCVICLEDFDVGMKVRRMPCSHIFHEHCLTQWLERDRICPYCRFEMP